MNIEIKTWLYDILKAVDEINDFFSDIPKDLQSYQQNIKTKRAVERNIEIIGEAMNRILNLGHSINLTNSRKIVDTRNRIIHGYDSVSDDIVWDIIINQLPTLKTEIEELLAS